MSVALLRGGYVMLDLSLAKCKLSGAPDLSILFARRQVKAQQDPGDGTKLSLGSRVVGLRVVFLRRLLRF